MSDRYPGGIITKTPVTPAGPYAEGSAPGVWTLEQQAYWAAQGVWPNASNPTPNDPYFQYVTSLLHGDGTNGGQNNTFLDSSSNAFSITRNGNTTQGSFSPYGSNWGNYLNGSSYFNIASNAAFALPGDFTWEAWVFVTTSGVETIYHGNVTDSLIVKIDSSNRVVVRQFAVADLITTTTTVPTNTWTHIAVSRSSTSLAVWINGSVGGTATNSTSFATSAVYIGADDGGNNKLSGYISNLRLVKGTAVYNPSSSTITVPTTPLTAISGTSLLTCQANRFIDASTNAFTLTINSTPQVTRFSPFAPTYATQYSASTIGGSGYFDGSGDYLTVANNTALDMGTGDFTLEFWLYSLTASQDTQWRRFVCTGQNSSAAIQVGHLGSSNGTVSYTADDSSLTVTGTTNVLNQWAHIAVVRQSGTVKLYVNGTSEGTPITDNNSKSSTDFTIGHYPSLNGYTNGYISNLRLVKGTAVYTSNFTPSTTPLTAISGTSLLTNMTNGAIYDNAMIPNYETVGNAQISTSVKKYGTGSLAFDGTGDYLVTANRTEFNLGSGNFTIEAWVYTGSSSEQCIVGAIQNSNGSGSWMFNLNYNSKKLRFYCRYNSGTALDYQAGDGTLNDSTWTHVAVSRVGSALKMFINGTQVGTTNTTLSTYSIDAASADYRVGSTTDSASIFNGYIDDLRITKGYARYWENFTPPAAALPNFGGAYQVPTQDPQFNYTTLLLPGNGTNGAQNNTFLDSSTNAFTITRNGNTTQGTFTPFSQTGWSNYFDGTSDYLNYGTNTNTQLGGATNFTIEAWVYPTAYNSYGPIVTNSASGTLGFGKLASGFGIRKWGTGDIVYTANTPPIGQWTHVAAVKSGNNYYIFYNGTIQATATSTETYSNGNFSIGGDTGAATEAWIGYISNVRFINNQALSTTNFTPPTSPVTTTSVGWTGSGVASSITGTVGVLACQNNRFIDNSGNGYTISVGGTPSVQAFSPFAPTAAYSASTVGGSGYFDGTGDYLSTSTTQIIPATGDFSIDGWFYYYGANYPVILSQGTSGNAGSLLFYVNSKRLVLQIGASDIVAGANTVKPYEWNYVSATRTGSTATIYVNGTQVATGTLSGTIQNSALNVGLDLDGNSAACNISNLRISTSIRTYSGAPTAPVTNDANTKLLLNFTNAGITDATAKNDLETVGNAQISTTQSKFGGSSIAFDGSGDYLTVPNSQSILFGSGDWTVEFWVYPSSLTGDLFLYCLGYGYSNTDRSLIIYSSSGALRMAQSPDGSTNYDVSLGLTLSTNTWQHVAVVRYGSTVTPYLNGVAGTSQTAQNLYATTKPLFINNQDSQSSYMNGYMQDVRITKGYARYVQPFTPPAQADQLY